VTKHSWYGVRSVLVLAAIGAACDASRDGAKGPSLREVSSAKVSKAEPNPGPTGATGIILKGDADCNLSSQATPITLIVEDGTLASVLSLISSMGGMKIILRGIDGNAVHVTCNVDGPWDCIVGEIARTLGASVKVDVDGVVVERK
jgi:hypothetical protein